MTSGDPRPGLLRITWPINGGRPYDGGYNAHLKVGPWFSQDVSIEILNFCCSILFPVELGQAFSFETSVSQHAYAVFQDGLSGGFNSASATIQFFEADGTTPALIDEAAAPFTVPAKLLARPRYRLYWISSEVSLWTRISRRLASHSCTPSASFACRFTGTPAKLGSRRHAFIPARIPNTVSQSAIAPGWVTFCCRLQNITPRPQAVWQFQQAKRRRRNLKKRYDGFCDPLIDRASPTGVAEFAEVKSSRRAWESPLRGRTICLISTVFVPHLVGRESGDRFFNSRGHPTSGMEVNGISLFGRSRLPWETSIQLVARM